MSKVIPIEREAEQYAREVASMGEPEAKRRAARRAEVRAYRAANPSRRARRLMRLADGTRTHVRREPANYAARIAAQGAAWLAANPDGDLRRAVASILWWDYEMAFPKPAVSHYVDCDVVDRAQLRDALRACGYSDAAIDTRGRIKACRAGYGNATKRGGNHKRMIGRAGTQQETFGIWAEPWTDGNSHAPKYHGSVI